MRRLLVTAIGLAAICLAALGPARVGHAQRDADEAGRIHYQAATEYYSVGDYESALAEFTRAYELSGRPQLLYNLYLCQERLAHLPEAIEDLDRFLREAPNVPERATLEARLDNLRARLEAQQAAQQQAAQQQAAQQQAAQQQAASDTETGTGATSNTPTETAAQAPDTQTETGATSDTPAEAAARAPEVASGEAAPATGGPAASATTSPRTDRADGDGESAPAAHRRRVVAGYTLLGVAALAAVGVGVFGALAAKEDGRLEDLCDTRCAPSQADTLRAYQNGADASLAVGLVALGVGLGLALSGGGGERSPEATSVALSASPDGVFAAARGSF